MVFPSKKDRWLTLILILAVAVQVVAGTLLMFVGPWWVGTLLLLAAAFIVWTMQSTYYVLGETNLVVRSGPFRWTILLNEIEDIRPTHNPLSSPALSLDRLWIHFRRGGKKRAMMISPVDQAEFIKAIAAARRAATPA